MSSLNEAQLSSGELPLAQGLHKELSCGADRATFQTAKTKRVRSITTTPQEPLSEAALDYFYRGNCTGDTESQDTAVNRSAGLWWDTAHDS